MGLADAVNYVYARYIPYLPEGVVVNGRSVPAFVPWTVVRGWVQVPFSGDNFAYVLNYTKVVKVESDEEREIIRRYGYGRLDEKPHWFETAYVLRVPGSSIPDSFRDFWLRSVRGEWKKWKGAARVYGALFEAQLRRACIRFKMYRDKLIEKGVETYIRFMIDHGGLMGGTFIQMTPLIGILNEFVVFRVGLPVEYAMDWLRRSLHLGFPILRPPEGWDVGDRICFGVGKGKSLAEAVENALGW